MDKQPTELQVKKFWEWCGLVHINRPQRQVANSCEAMTLDTPVNGWYKPNFKQGTSELVTLKSTPKIDLNSLFKYAVPKLLGKIGKVKTVGLVNKAVCDAVESKGEIALALFWAINSVIENYRGGD